MRSNGHSYPYFWRSQMWELLLRQPGSLDGRLIGAGKTSGSEARGEDAP